jgi:hypothetical protein
MNTLLSKKTSIILFMAYIYFAVFGLVGVGSHHHMTETRCPYMMGMNIVCRMDDISHISFWKLILSIFPSSFFVLLFFVCTYYVSNKLFYISPHIIQNLLYIKRSKLKPIYLRLVQDYSDGRINPKLY